MAPRTLAIMQVWHLAFLALVPITLAAFRMMSESYDPSRVLVDNVVLIGGVLFSTYSLVFVVITGRSDDALPSVLKLYRQSLSHRSFLGVSNTLLTVIFAFLIYQLMFYRQVEFLSPIDVEIYLGDTVGKPERLAFVRAKTPASLRLSIGTHQVAAKDLVTQQWIASQIVNVPSLLAEPRMLSTWIKPSEDRYEKLK